MPATELNSFHNSLKNLDYTRKKMERLFSERRIVKRDLESVYESLFLRAVTSFESFLEALFIAILREKVTYTGARVSVRIKTTPKGAIWDILLQRDQYLTWLPYNNTEDRAKLYLKDGRPFSDLTDGDRSTIMTITTIRNAIAHKSEHAMGQFRNKVIGSMALLPQERSPAGFLRSPVRGGQQNRFQVYVAELGRVAAALT